MIKAALLAKQDGQWQTTFHDMMGHNYHDNYKLLGNKNYVMISSRGGSTYLIYITDEIGNEHNELATYVLQKIGYSRGNSQYHGPILIFGQNATSLTNDQIQEINRFTMTFIGSS